MIIFDELLQIKTVAMKTVQREHKTNIDDYGFLSQIDVTFSCLFVCLNVNYTEYFISKMNQSVVWSSFLL